MSVINTNITSMIGQQNLRESQNALSTSMERLSSGLRINSAKDDAAGQAIANRMSAQITGLAQAQRNANDGISVSQTAEGGLNQINDNLQRVRELTVQAENGTNSTADLQSIQDEIGQRLNEINRISDETDFNGTKVLKEGIESLSIQVGANDGETISVNLQAINTEQLGMEEFSVGGFLQVDNTEASAADLTGTFGFTQAGSTLTSGQASAANIADALAEGDSITAGNTQYTVDAGATTVTQAFSTGTVGDVSSAFTTGTGNGDFTVSQGSFSATGEVTIGGGTLSIGGSSVYIDGSGNLTLTSTTTAVADMDALLGASGGAVTVSQGDVEAVSDGGGNYDVTTQNVALGTAETALAAGGTATVGGTGYTVSAADEATFTTGGATAYYDSSTQELTDTAVNYYEQDDGTINTAEDGSGDALYLDGEADPANSALTTEATYTDTDQEAAKVGNLETIDDALSQVDSLRSELGAVQNRFESAITNLSTNETNLSAARSRIEDADYATEVADMTRSQILQQAGTSVLAQANQIPQNVLSLLG